MLDAPGAILDAEIGTAEPARVIAAWREALAPMLEAVGWIGTPVAARAWPGGVSLAFAAPADALYAATEVNEWAFGRARAALGGAGGAGDTELARSIEGRAGETFAASVERLRESIARERNPRLLALAAAAERHGVTLLADDRRVSLGLGDGSRSWPVEETPDPERVRWDELHDVPVALITGTNGKSTTVRLLAAIAAAAGRIAGSTSTDRVDVGDETVAHGDYSGPNGARTVLRDRRVEVGILEVARGGILRRGLPVTRVAAALVTNVANDHLGEFGIFDVEALADAKLVVAKAVVPGGRVVLNADDARLLERGRSLAAAVTWFTLDAAHPHVREHVARGGDACWLEDGALVFARGGRPAVLARAAEVPVTHGGIARHNVANALAAAGVAAALGFTDEAIARGLRAFDNSPHANPGRANLWRLGGVTVVVDFAHNPHGIEALAAMAAALPARRRGLVVGQAGDRDDGAIREFAEAAWRMRPDRVFVKEMEIYLRGRERGVVPALIERTLREAGAPAGAIEHHDSELEAVRRALQWAREGDLLLLTVHAEREAVIALVERLAANGWAPGTALPEAVRA